MNFEIGVGHYYYKYDRLLVSSHCPHPISCLVRLIHRQPPIAYVWLRFLENTPKLQIMHRDSRIFGLGVKVMSLKSFNQTGRNEEGKQKQQCCHEQIIHDEIHKFPQ